ncbi:MAG: alpha/beta fold hydrolase [Myxococcaceae bacterium]|jgi:3-oxoadipate enol-lactonase|nr:alpha/beta fold hydrolase [Myxococcaceae bacterium]MCA3014759.1 alpha/beta fold hydrolase [Myxococcaceae bacterium]
MTPTTPLRRITTRAGSLAVRDEGAGVPVVFWPSLFSDHHLYAHVRPLLRGWRVVCIDGPGFGESDPPRGDVQADVYADAVLEVLDALGVGEAFVAGCSWGGQVAVQAGVRAPSRVKGVLAMNTPLGPSRGGHLFERLGTRWLGATRFWGDGVGRSMFSAATKRAHPERVAAFSEAFTRFDARAAAATVRTVLTRSEGFTAVLPRLSVPATFLLGEEDQLYPVAHLRPLAQLAPLATVEVVPGCGHLAPLEAPEAVATALRRLAKAPGA